MHILKWTPIHLSSIFLFHNKDLTPGLDSCCLSLTASPPGETSQRLVVSSHPWRRWLQRHIDKRHYWCECSEMYLSMHAHIHVTQLVLNTQDEDRKLRHVKDRSHQELVLRNDTSDRLIFNRCVSHAWHISMYMGGWRVILLSSQVRDNLAITIDLQNTN